MDVVVGKDAYYLLSHAGTSDRQQVSRELSKVELLSQARGHVLRYGGVSGRPT